MPSFTIATNGQTMVVSAVTLPAGGTPIIYTSAAYSSSVTLPTTITADTTYYLREPEALVTVLQPDGSTILSAARVVDGSTVAPAPSAAQVAADVGRGPLVCVVKRTTTQALGTNSVDAISWSSAEYNDRAIWASGSPTLLTIPSGISSRPALVTATFDFSAVNTTVAGNIVLNSTDIAWDIRVSPASGSTHWSMTVSAGCVVSAADTITIKAYSLAGSNNILANTFNPRATLVIY